MRTIMPCPEAPSRGNVSTEKKNETPAIDEIMIRTTHRAAVRVTWPGGTWANFKEDGTFFSRSVSISDKDVAEARKILPNMEDIATQRRAFRAFLKEEMERVKNDERVYHPGGGHSKFIGGCSSRLWNSMAEELKTLGYQTTDVWEPWCQQHGCDTRNWCLWPPTDLLAEKEYIVNI